MKRYKVGSRGLYIEVVPKKIVGDASRQAHKPTIFIKGAVLGRAAPASLIAPWNDQGRPGFMPSGLWDELPVTPVPFITGHLTKMGRIAFRISEWSR
jgi:hypothetical protein